MTTQIQLRRDTAANWAAANPVLAEGEIGMDMTVNSFKVGDGSSAWSDIEYAGTDISLGDYYTKTESDDAFQPKGDYLTDFVEEDPTVPVHVKGITQDDIDGWNAAGEGGQDVKQIWSETSPDGDIFYNKGNVSTTGTLGASGAVVDRGIYRPSATGAGFRLSNASAILPSDGTGTQASGVADFGSNSYKWKDAYFSGTVTAGEAVIEVAVHNGANGVALRNSTAGTGVIITNNGIQFDPIVDDQINLGAPARRFKDAAFSGTVDAAGFTVNGAPISGGGGGTGLPDGGYSYGWEITATDFIATSDERLKTRIAPMPIGLIDDIKPVSWEWIDGGGKSAGVVAQQLQEVGLGDYVHETEDGQLGVNYQALTAILLAEVIALKKAIK